MRRVGAQFGRQATRGVHRVTSVEDLSCNWSPDVRLLATTASEEDQRTVEALAARGLTNVSWVSAEGLQCGDVIVADPERSEARVSFRESDMHHSLFLTNRCNSFCLMCSQPPSKNADPWILEQALETVRHIRHSPVSLGLTGGEPLLLGAGLRRVIDAIGHKHPSTRVEVLTNGRLFCNAETSEAVLGGLQSPVYWMIPLYGHADFVHDFVVQSRGAFEETLQGILALQDLGQPIQLRIVLVTPVLAVLKELCSFIGRNLPFVNEVALMACEPIGFALANRDQCEVNLRDWGDTLVDAARILDRYSVEYLFMNAPLCGLPRSLWPKAHRSISDWKNAFVAECEPCVVKERCAGLFAWHEKGWRPTRIRPIVDPLDA